MERNLRILAKIAILCFLLSQCRNSSPADRSPHLPQSEKSPESNSKDEVPARGVVIDGNGGEHITNEYNPWFLGADTVNYCLKHDPSAFSVDPNQARTAIAAVLKTWQDFVRSQYPSKLEAPFLLAQKGIVSLSLDFAEVSCTEEHELEFLLGVTEADMNEALKYRAGEIIGLSFRDHYSDETGRAKGRIWLAADLGEKRYSGPNPGPGFWGMQYNLLNVLTHELGHVFGVKHSERGLMAADFPAKMLEFGLNAPVGRDSLANEFWLCGKIVPEHGRDISPTLLKLFGLDRESIDKVCLDSTYVSPPHKFDTVEGDRHSLTFSLKDGTKKAFDGILTSLRGPYQTIGGNFLAQANDEDVHYGTFNFLYFDGPLSGQGIQSTSVGDFFVSYNSYLPGTMTLSIGFEGNWQDIVLVKDSPEVNEMIKLAEAERKEYSILSLSLKTIQGGTAPATEHSPDSPGTEKGNKASFTPESLLIPLSSLSLLTWLGDPVEAVTLYQCKGLSSEECLVDVRDPVALEKLASSIRIEDGHYNGIEVKPVCTNGEYTSKVKGRFTLRGLTYYTQAGKEMLGTDATKFDYADVTRKCEGSNIVVFPVSSFVTKIAGGKFPFTLYFDSNYAAVGDPGLPTEDGSPRSPSINLGLRVFPHFGDSDLRLESYKIVDQDKGAQGLLKFLKDDRGAYLDVISEEFHDGASGSPALQDFPSRYYLFARKEAFTDEDEKGRGGPIIETLGSPHFWLHIEGFSTNSIVFEEFQLENHSGRFYTSTKSEWVYYTATKF